MNNLPALPYLILTTNRQGSHSFPLCKEADKRACHVSQSQADAKAHALHQVESCGAAIVGHTL